MQRRGEHFIRDQTLEDPIQEGEEPLQGPGEIRIFPLKMIPADLGIKRRVTSVTQWSGRIPEASPVDVLIFGRKEDVTERINKQGSGGIQKGLILKGFTR